MLTIRTACAAAALMLALPLATSPAGAAPLSVGAALSTPLAKSFDGDLTQVQYRRGYRRGPGPGAIIGGLAAGAILGGIVASQAQPYYGPGYYAPPPPVVYAAPPGGDDVAYCMQTYRSYDPRSGTYMGYDGYRHPCP